MKPAAPDGAAAPADAKAGDANMFFNLMRSGGECRPTSAGAYHDGAPARKAGASGSADGRRIRVEGVAVIGADNWLGEMKAAQLLAIARACA